MSDDAKVCHQLGKKGRVKAKERISPLLETGTSEPSEIDKLGAGPVFPKLNLTRGPAAWWKFDEKSGKVANDFSGRLRAGKLIGYLRTPPNGPKE